MRGRVVVTMVTNCINIAAFSRSVLLDVCMIQTAKENVGFSSL
jgi:hypothetical protein